MIRKATVDDVPRAVAMGVRFLADTAYHDSIATNPAQLADIAERLATRDDSVLFVSEQDGEIVGMIGAYIYAHPYSSEPFATELFWWVEPEHRGQGVRLLKQVQQWAATHGAVKLQVVAPNERVANVYERLGFAKVETCYQRSLCQQG